MLNPPNLSELPDIEWAVFLDIDGTLLDIASHPEQVLVPEDLTQLLKQLNQRVSGACALVSGRELTSIDRLFEWRECDAAGCHGAQIRVQGSIWNAFAPGNVLRSIADHLIAATVPHYRAFVEIKPQSIALHYGGSTLNEVSARALVSNACALSAGSLRILPFRGGFELIPQRVGKDKAIARFLTYARYLGRTPIFAGDDVTDEDGFAEVNARGGISIYLGEANTSVAKFGFKKPVQLRRWLRDFCSTMPAGRPN